MIQESATLPNYNYEIDRYPHEATMKLNWKQRLSALEPRLRSYFTNNLREQLATGVVEVSEEGRIFGNKTRAEVVNEVVDKWVEQGCPLLNLSKWIDWVYDAAEQEILNPEVES